MEGREGNGREGRERRGDGEGRRTRKESKPCDSHGAIATCATPDLLLKHPDRHICNIRLKRDETLVHLKHLQKKPKNT
jgi:hypothetical protein